MDNIHQATKVPLAHQRPLRVMMSEKAARECSDCEQIFQDNNIVLLEAPENGTGFYSALELEQPDIVVLDVFMPGMDAIPLKAKHDKSGCKGAIFYTVSPTYEQSTLNELRAMGFSHHFTAPVKAKEIVSRIKHKPQWIWMGSNTREDVEEVTRMLLELGMPAHIKGYAYVRQAILIVEQEPAWIHAVTLKLYPEIARQNGTIPTRVERAIRHAIEVAFSRCDADVLQAYFGWAVNANRGKATNSEFIATLVDRMLVQKVHSDTANMVVR